MPDEPRELPEQKPSASEEIPAGAKDVLRHLEALRSRKPSAARIQAEIGDDAVIPRPDVDVTLHPSREIPIAGELWSIAGDVHNRSEVPIWIVDHTTRVSLAPEMYGSSKRTGSVAAFFPTVTSRLTSEIVRVDPGANYAVIWKLDPLAERDNPEAERTTLRRVVNAIRDYAFFNPGTFRVAATVHVWPIFDTLKSEVLRSQILTAADVV